MVFEGRAPYLWWETDRRVSTPSMLRVDYDRWGQTPEELRQLATSAAHQRTRERFLALYEVTQASCATQVAARTQRHPQTVMEWLHLYNAGGPEALTFRRTGGRRPLFLGQQSWLAGLPLQFGQVSLGVAAEAGAQGSRQAARFQPA